MEEIIKISAVAVIGAVCAILIKQYRPELTVFVQLAGFIAVLSVGTVTVTKVISYCENVFSQEIIDVGYLSLLIKALAIAIVSKFAGEICRDSGNNVLGFGVDLIAKAAILLLTLPMLKNLADVTSGLLKG
ncbi:MAG: hypothetical protein IJZ88_08560 [Clostridia bacterium]|nr:hypothetical protein [Clostridia bacterium]